MNWAKVQCKTYHLLGVGFAAAAIAAKVPCYFHKSIRFWSYSCRIS